MLKYKYQDNLHLFLLQVSTTPYSDFNFCTPPCHGVAMMADSNLKYLEVFRIHGSTIISMLRLTIVHVHVLMYMWQSQVENEHYSTVSGLIRLVISLECFIEITPDFLCPFMND